jgi:hypothetical protein
MRDAGKAEYLSSENTDCSRTDHKCNVAWDDVAQRNCAHAGCERLSEDGVRRHSVPQWVRTSCGNRDKLSKPARPCATDELAPGTDVFTA